MRAKSTLPGVQAEPARADPLWGSDSRVRFNAKTNYFSIQVKSRDNVCGSDCTVSCLFRNRSDLTVLWQTRKSWPDKSLSFAQHYTTQNPGTHLWYSHSLKPGPQNHHLSEISVPRRHFIRIELDAQMHFYLLSLSKRDKTPL